MVGSAKKYYALAALVAWLIIVAFFMIMNRTLDLEVYFVLALIGILVVAVMIDGAFSRPRYMRYIGYLIAVGVAIFAYIVAEKILEILAS
jgi:dolichyl-phosphate-mannose--protein O-mannosyl transferase